MLVYSICFAYCSSFFSDFPSFLVCLCFFHWKWDKQICKCFLLATNSCRTGHNWACLYFHQFSVVHMMSATFQFPHCCPSLCAIQYRRRELASFVIITAVCFPSTLLNYYVSSWIFFRLFHWCQLFNTFVLHFHSDYYCYVCVSGVVFYSFQRSFCPCRYESLPSVLNCAFHAEW